MLILSILKTLATLINYSSERLEVLRDITIRGKHKAVILLTENRETEEGRLGSILLVRLNIHSDTYTDLG
jgi:hypothetical protein